MADRVFESIMDRDIYTAFLFDPDGLKAVFPVFPVFPGGGVLRCSGNI
jgi:hypothetical protein